LSSRTGKSLNTYDKVYRFSIENPPELWSEPWDFTNISGDKGTPPLCAAEPRPLAVSPTCRLVQRADREAAALRQSDPAT
jgi:hypothetical protein